MSRNSRTYVHYACDKPGCGKEADSETDVLAGDNFRTLQVDAGEPYEVYKATFCVEHARELHAELLRFGFEKRLR